MPHIVWVGKTSYSQRLRGWVSADILNQTVRLFVILIAPSG